MALFNYDEAARRTARVLLASTRHLRIGLRFHLHAARERAWYLEGPTASHGPHAWPNRAISRRNSSKHQAMALDRLHQADHAMHTQPGPPSPSPSPGTQQRRHDFATPFGPVQRSLCDLLSAAPAQREHLAEKALVDGRIDRSGGAAKRCRATMAEVALGRMRPPMAKERVTQCHGYFWVCTMRFTIQQGRTHASSVKSRDIDDLTDSCNNLAAVGKQKILMASVAIVMNKAAYPATLSTRAALTPRPLSRRTPRECVQAGAVCFGPEGDVHQIGSNPDRRPGAVPRALRQALRCRPRPLRALRRHRHRSRPWQVRAGGGGLDHPRCRVRSANGVSGGPKSGECVENFTTEINDILKHDALSQSRAAQIVWKADFRRPPCSAKWCVCVSLATLRMRQSRIGGSTPIAAYDVALDVADHGATRLLAADIVCLR